MDGLHLDGLRLGLFLAAAFFGGLTSGLSGFAMGLVVSGVWLHIIAPDQNLLSLSFAGSSRKATASGACDMPLIGGELRPTAC